LSSNPAGARGNSPAPSLEFEPWRARLSEPDVFERPTVVPDVAADEHARSLMRSVDASQLETGVAPAAEPERAAAPEADPRPRPTAAPSTEQRPESASAVPEHEPSRQDLSLSLGALELDIDAEGSALGLVELQSGVGRSAAEFGPAEQLLAEGTTAAEATDTRSRALSLSDLYQLGDFSGALQAAESRLEGDPEDEEALRYRQRCQEVLTTMWTARLGAPDRPLKMLIAADQLRWLSVDHRAGFLISLIDGRATLDQVLDIAGMPRLDALRILAELAERGVIEVVR
jgi:hypothetical protein